MALANPQTPTGVPVNYEQAIRGAIALSQPGEPDWLPALRNKAWSRFGELGLPNPRQEAWKYLPLQSLLSTPFQNQSSIHMINKNALEGQYRPAMDLNLEAHYLDHANRLIFTNGNRVPHLSVMSGFPDGVLATDLKSALIKNPNVLEPLLAKTISSDVNPFVVINTALFEDGFVLVVPDNVQLEKPIQIIYHTDNGENEPLAVYPRHLISLGKNSSATVVVQFVGGGSSRYFNNLVQELLIADDAKLDMSVIQLETPHAWHLAGTRAWLNNHSKLEMHSITLGGHISRHGIRATFQGENAECVLNGLNVLRQASEVYCHTLLDHAKPNNVSQQLYKSILDDATKSEFHGQVHVAPDANGTDSKQLNKNLILSENARAYTRPQLQISADDVKCAHGATVGQLEPEQLFYMASRGIEHELAECLLTYGFAEDVILKLQLPALQTYLNNLLLQQLDQHQNPLGCDVTCKTCGAQK